MSRNEKGKAHQAPEKSSFTRRCTLLGRYLKEKGSFGNINFGLVRKPDSDINLPEISNLLPGKQNAIERAVSKGELSTSSGGKVKDAADLSISEPGTSQLTIFFGGKVLVYNEFPSDKAQEIMEVAKQANPVTKIRNIQTQINVESNNKSNMVLPDLNEPTNSADINQQQQQNQLVERIARRASLHRFFAKRKDRVVARAPYQVNQIAGHHPPKLETVRGQSLEPGQSSQRRDNHVAQFVAHPKPEGDKDSPMEIEKEGQSLKDLDLKL
ncbi:hypothetical protein AALP_AA1G192200 [Arabis alpina]|uniref:Protein TIFY n=1 Tax=Arabis alpina TaxID=50452 RepID=A0A087HP75_ARAAL|nr:hypothetical protein AALP_AA1G192200 [Arabis alpina]